MGADKSAPSDRIRPLLQRSESLREINIAAGDAGLEQFADHLPQTRPFRHETELPTGPGRAQSELESGSQRHSPTCATKIDGDPRGYYFDLVGRPTTAHFIGGCPIGDSPTTGVVDPYQRLYGYPGLHVIDGSAITANLGVNPALTITALSERAVALWPNKAGPDPRPALGSPYRRVSPVRPRNPIVPESAPAALRLSTI
ncbi:GMC oxidoreductase [Mycobacterium sp.]